MSIYFDLKGVTIWNPSNGVAALFLSQVSALGNLLHCETGFYDTKCDEVRVDFAAFREFMRAVLSEFSQSTNESKRRLLHGVVVQVVALYLKCEEDLFLLDGADADLLLEARKLSRKLPI